MGGSVTLEELFGAAEDEGNISPGTVGILNVPAIGAQIQAGMGIDVDKVTASEVFLVAQMPDDSGSIRFSGNAQTVRDGHNLVVDALGESKSDDSIQALCRFLNGHVLYPYGPLSDAVKMTSRNYDPNQGTPLYDQAVALLATVLAKTQEFSDQGIPARSATLIITDGRDEHSVRNTAADVKAVVDDMLMAETHIVAGMGIGDPAVFDRVFEEMGIPKEWRLLPGNTPSEVRRAFAVFSKSAVRASQGGASFSQTAAQGVSGAGGFGA